MLKFSEALHGSGQKSWVVTAGITHTAAAGSSQASGEERVRALEAAIPGDITSSLWSFTVSFFFFFFAAVLGKLLI